jgi:hypothetical protein
VPNPNEMGALTHGLLARLAREGKLTLTPLELWAEVAAEVAARPSLQRAPTVRQAVRKALHVGARSYLRFFAPGSEATFVGAELAAGRARFDLVWKTEAGDYWADEIKGGRVRRGHLRLPRQLSAEVAAGRALWGDRFIGVRVCMLAFPTDSLMAHADGTTEPLFDGGDHGS